MTGETLKRANDITKDIADLKLHKQRVLEYANNLKKIVIGVQRHDNQNYEIELRPHLFVIAADRQMQFYVDEVDKMISKLEAELAAL